MKVEPLPDKGRRLPNAWAAGVLTVLVVAILLGYDFRGDDACDGAGPSAGGEFAVIQCVVLEPAVHGVAGTLAVVVFTGEAAAAGAILVVRDAAGSVLAEEALGGRYETVKEVRGAAAGELLVFSEGGDGTRRESRVEFAMPKP